jgi:mannose-6-phosphate isomerase-like protein (cupin superfamily)
MAMSPAASPIRLSAWGGVVLFVLICTTVGGVLGYQRTQLLYRSEGQIRFNHDLAGLNDDPDAETVFNNYVATQIARLQTQQVISMAMQYERWRKLPVEHGDESDSFRRQLTVGQGRRPGLILVTYTSPDAVVAQTAVEAVIDAYMRFGAEKSKAARLPRLEKLNELRTKKQNQIEHAKQELSAITDGDSRDALEFKLAHEIEAVYRTEMQLGQKQIELADWADQRPTPTPPPPPDAKTPRKRLSIDEVAARKPQLKALIEQRSRLVTDLAVMKELGLQSNHRRVIPAKVRLEQVDVEIKRLSEAFNEQWLTKRPDHGPPLQDARALFRQERQLRATHDAAKQKVMELRGKLVEIAQIRATSARYEVELSAVRDIIEKLNVEPVTGGRIEILSRGERPSMQISAAQRRHTTAVGLAGGGVFGVCISFLVNLLNRRRPPIKEVKPQAPAPIAVVDPTICIVHLGREQTIGEELAQLLNPVDPTSFHIYRLPANTDIPIHYQDMDEYWFFISGHPKVTLRSANGVLRQFTLEPGDLVATVRGVEHTLWADHELVYYQYTSILNGTERPGHLTRERPTAD